MSTAPARRPGGVTLLVVLIVIHGVLAAVAGALIIIFRSDQSFLDQVQAQAAGTASDELLWYGIGTVVIGLIYLLVAQGLAHGNGFSRFLVALVSVIALVGGIYLAIRYAGTLRWQGIIEAALGLVVLLLLYSPRASEFFRTN